MRAREFTINIPIRISINGDNDPVISTTGDDTSDDASDESKLQQNPVMVGSLQQEIELRKAELGKKSPVIDKLIQNSNLGKEPETKEPEPKEPEPKEPEYNESMSSFKNLINRLLSNQTNN